MINNLKYSTIADIGIYDLMFYDVNEEKRLIDFCKYNNISYLPSRNRMEVYKLVNDRFELKPLDEVLVVNPYDRIFEKQTLDKFKHENKEENEIRFILEDGRIKGVVHIIDYNNEFIQVELYRALFRFESNLRALLIKNYLTNEDFIDWVKERGIKEKDKNSKAHWERRYNELVPDDSEKSVKKMREREEVNPFQTFYLLELMRFANDKGLIDKKQINIKEIANLRNEIAHNKKVTSYIEEGDTLVFNYDSLVGYVSKINKFFKGYDYLKFLLEK